MWSIVKQMPRFPGCEELQTLREKNKCSNQKFMEYIYEHLEYPEEAIKNNQLYVVILLLLHQFFKFAKNSLIYSGTVTIKICLFID